MPSTAYRHGFMPLFEARVGLHVQYCGRYRCKAQWSIPTTRLAKGVIGFYFVEKNECWAIVNGRRLVLREGDLLIIREGDEFSLGHDARRPHTSLSISLRIEQEALHNGLLQRAFSKSYRLRQPGDYIRYFDSIIEAFESPLTNREWAVCGALLQWVSYVLSETKAPVKHLGGAGTNGIERILSSQRWAIARIGKVVTLREWAGSCGLHSVYFERLFRKETGLSPMRWLEERRMNVARQYLLGSSQTVADVAEQVGYADQFCFSKVFRKHFGKSPVQFRKMSLSIPIISEAEIRRSYPP